MIIIWSDIDSLITNYDIRMQDLIDDHYDLVITMEDPCLEQKTGRRKPGIPRRGAEIALALVVVIS